MKKLIAILLLLVAVPVNAEVWSFILPPQLFIVSSNGLPYVTPPGQQFTIDSISALATGAGVSCSTPGTIEVFDVTSGTSLGTLTVSSLNTITFATFATAPSGQPGDTIVIRLKSGACTTPPWTLITVGYHLS